MLDVVIHRRIRECHGENTSFEVQRIPPGYLQYDGASVRMSDDTHVPSSSFLNKILPDVAAMILGSRNILGVDR